MASDTVSCIDKICQAVTDIPELELLVTPDAAIVPMTTTKVRNNHYYPYYSYYPTKPYYANYPTPLLPLPLSYSPPFRHLGQTLYNTHTHTHTTHTCTHAHTQASGLDIYSIASEMEKKGWNMFTGQHPAVCARVCVCGCGYMRA